MPIMETAPHASRDMRLKRDNASSLTLIMLNHLIQAVVFGIGITKFALNALKDGFSMISTLVLPHLTFVRAVMMLLDSVLLATKVTILKKDNVFSLHQITHTQQILDVEHGTGQIKFA